MTTSQAIRERITAHPAGEPFTPALFAGLGSRAAIDQTLMRLAQTGRIERIAHGLYLVPEAPAALALKRCHLRNRSRTPWRRPKAQPSKSTARRPHAAWG